MSTTYETRNGEQIVRGQRHELIGSDGTRAVYENNLGHVLSQIDLRKLVSPNRLRRKRWLREMK